MNREPLLTVASITAGATAVLGLLMAFGLSLTGDQEKAILGVAAFVAPLVVGFAARPKVTPVAPVAPRNEAGQSALVLILAVVGVVLLLLLLLPALRH